MKIQMDMYAVELGAALLLQFETPQGLVRILADAGEAKYDVNSRLGRSMQRFGGDSLHIDLMIGTHYDADHLDGLVAVIENPDITIGEAWLPPVANDTEMVPHESALRDSSLLALQFASDAGSTVLRDYLIAKAVLCTRLSNIERQVDGARGIYRGRIERDGNLEEMMQNFSSHHEAALLARSYFESEVIDAERTIGGEVGGHADVDTADPWRNDEVIEKFGRSSEWAWDWPDGPSPDWLSSNQERAVVQVQTVAMIRQSAAKDAITAASLAAVVEALKKRGVKIRSSTVSDGKPRPFGWVKATGRFEPAHSADADSPTLTLLGPSEGLVNKFRNILPIGSYLFAARMMAIPIKSITPSNQLSYILVVEHARQRILISGDAGSVDFGLSGSKEFHVPLIEKLSPLHVVQVAHHAGNNAYFYRCLLASNYREQDATTYLLLSHATRDKHRPSDVFSKFIAGLGRTPADTQLLFTSTPQEAKVRDVTAFLAPVVGQAATAGDVRLEFDGREWRIAAHAVSIS